MRILAIALTLLASQAAALSCMRPDPVAAFQNALDAPERFYVLYGQIDFDEALLPQGLVNARPLPQPIAGVYRGDGLTKNGFRPTTLSDVIVQSSCAGPWCGRMAAGADHLMFAKQTDAGLVINVGPCGGAVFAAPTQDMLDQMVQCMRGEACVPADPSR